MMLMRSARHDSGNGSGCMTLHSYHTYSQTDVL
jgi:hypothetical protein